MARSDPHGMLATPVETVSRDHAGTADLIRIESIVTEIDAIEVVVGLPLALSGNRTASTNDAVGFAELLASRLTVPVRLVDERLSTVAAQTVLRAAGRKAKTQRPVVDQVAATIILQHALDTERALGTPPGSAVAPPGYSAVQPIAPTEGP